MRKFLLTLVIGMVLLSGCGKKEYTPQQTIQITKEATLGNWTDDEGESFDFQSGYLFSGKVNIDGNLVEISGDYNLVTDDASKMTTMTINTEKYRETFKIEGYEDGSTLVLKDVDTDEVVKELKKVG